MFRDYITCSIRIGEPQSFFNKGEQNVFESDYNQNLKPYFGRNVLPSAEMEHSCPF